MLPRSRPKVSRRRSADSLFIPNGTGSSTASSDDEDDCNMITHADEFLDDHLPYEYFQQDVLRLVHALRIPGWSLVTPDMAGELEMVRISGALTNSVYAVKPPVHIKESVKREYAGRPYHHRLPPNLLLRVYGPQVGILIDREKELRTVSQLTKHNIGPRLLGTFTNGRFEQFLNAKPLTKEDFWNPETSVQIAKRMQDLHTNIPLLESDLEDGICLWHNLDKWMPAAREQMMKLERKRPGVIKRVLRTNTFQEFANKVQNYRDYLNARYAGETPVFCHNDTQYGNILRLDPPKGSPLLRPQNEHRQLVVIDFEYSGPNNRAYDIANHFCEWMSDYHHPTMPHHIWTERYPNLEQQRRFVNSYVEQGASVFDEEKMEADVERLLVEVRDYRPAVSVIWAMWGIVQTPAETDQEIREEYLEKNPNYELSGSPDSFVEPEEVEDFDYLAYSSEKIALFWNDMEALNI